MSDTSLQHEAYKDQLRSSMDKPFVYDEELGKIVDKLYRPNATVGTGSTADALRQELVTGMPVGNKFHSQKAEDTIVELRKWLSKSPSAKPADRAAVENLIRDMANALKGD